MTPGSDEWLHLVAEFGPDESTVTCPTLLSLCIHAFKVAAHNFLSVSRTWNQKEASSHHESLVSDCVEVYGRNTSETRSSPECFIVPVLSVITNSSVMFDRTRPVHHVRKTSGDDLVSEVFLPQTSTQSDTRDLITAHFISIVTNCCSITVCSRGEMLRLCNKWIKEFV